MKIEQNLKENTSKTEVPSEGSFNNWVEEMNIKNGTFKNFKGIEPERMINWDDLLEKEPVIDEHTKRVNLRIQEVEDRQIELSNMIKNASTREEERELEKELVSLKKEISKNLPKGKENEVELKENTPHLEKVGVKIDQVKERQAELSKMRKSNDVILEEIELEKELVSLKKEIGDKIDKYTGENNINNNKAKEEEAKKERNKIITHTLYTKITNYEEKLKKMKWFNFFEKKNLNNILSNLKSTYQTIIFKENVNLGKLKKLSEIKELKEICNIIEKEPSIEKVSE